MSVDGSWLVTAAPTSASPAGNGTLPSSIQVFEVFEGQYAPVTVVPLRVSISDAFTSMLPLTPLKTGTDAPAMNTVTPP